MPFRSTFDCLWCGTAHDCRGPDDLEGWAHLCPDCVGKAGENGFLRFRLHQALAERGGATVNDPVAAAVTTATPPATVDQDAELLAYYEARAPEYDDWYLRRGRYARGPVHDAAWNAELDVAGRWLDGLPISGEIVELAAGTGWWSPLLAEKGELSLYDGAQAPLDRARERLVAHRLRAHLHIRDAWARTRPGGRCRLHRLLAQPRPARPARRVPRAGPTLAQAGRDVRLHRFAARPPVERGGPPEARRRRFGPVVWTTAGSSRSSRSITRPPSSRRPSPERASTTPP